MKRPPSATTAATAADDGRPAEPRGGGAFVDPIQPIAFEHAAAAPERARGLRRDASGALLHGTARRHGWSGNDDGFATPGAARVRCARGVFVDCCAFRALGGVALTIDGLVQLLGLAQLVHRRSGVARIGGFTHRLSVAPTASRSTEATSCATASCAASRPSSAAVRRDRRVRRRHDARAPRGRGPAVQRRLRRLGLAAVPRAARAARRAAAARAQQPRRPLPRRARQTGAHRRRRDMRLRPQRRLAPNADRRVRMEGGARTTSASSGAAVYLDLGSGGFAVEDNVAGAAVPLAERADEFSSASATRNWVKQARRWPRPATPRRATPSRSRPRRPGHRQAQAPPNRRRQLEVRRTLPPGRWRRGAALSWPRESEPSSRSERPPCRYTPPPY